MNLQNLLMSHAAKRGTHKSRGLLEKERNEDSFKFIVLLEIFLEPARNLSLLMLGEDTPAIVDTHRNDLFGLREVEVQGQAVPVLFHLFAFLPFDIRDELRFHVNDEENLTVILRFGLPHRVERLLFFLLAQQ